MPPIDNSKLSSKVQVIHATERIAEKLEELTGKRNKKDKILTKVTYHDPCHLGRLGGIFESPRKILKCCCEEVIEMEHNRYDANCCGVGGGVRASFHSLSEDIGKKRPPLCSR